MGTIGNILADSAGVGLRYAKRLTKDIPPELFRRLASVEGKLINSNHPAFVLGHLSLYPARTLEFLGKDVPLAATPPDGYETVFSQKATCVDDPDGLIYPTRDDIISFFDHAYDEALKALREASDELLSSKNPVDSPMAQVCTSLGSMLGFYMNGHVTMHLGQVSAWRRMQGMPAA